MQVVEDEVAGRGDEASHFACENGDHVMIDLLKFRKESEAVANDVEFKELFGAELLSDALLDGGDDFFGGNGGEDGWFAEGETEVVFHEGNELGIGDEVFLKKGRLRER